MKIKLKTVVRSVAVLMATVLVVMATPASALFAAADVDVWVAPKFVVLGDSIAAEYGSRGNGYASIVANTQGFDLNILARDGWTTRDVIDQLSNDYSAQYDVANADIIQLVIGGNDLRESRTAGPAIDAIDRSGDYTLWNAHCDVIAERFATIVELVRELNPDAPFFVFNQYTPNVKSLSFLPAGYVFGATRFITGTRLYEYAQNRAIPYWNSTFEVYLEQNPGAFMLVNVFDAFPNNTNSYYMTDTIHPSASGHVMLAQRLNVAIDIYNAVNIMVSSNAVVTKLNGNQNKLTVTVTERFPLQAPSVYSETFMIANNSADYFIVGDYTVFVNTKGNVQIRDCYLVSAK